MRKHRARFVAAMAAGALTLGGVGAADAAPRQDGLVNVNISDVDVRVPIGIAANICDTSANVLAQQLKLGPTECDATATSIASPGSNGGGSPNQEGLVNVNISDLTVLVPVSVAANLCDTNVNVLADQVDLGGAECDATAESIASPGQSG
jgi:hypothetical protein